MRSFILGVGIAALTMISGLVTINIDHHMILPDEVSSSNVITTVSSFDPLTLSVRHTTDIRLKNEIKDEDSVKAIVKVLQEAKYGDIVNFHISGYGGQVNTTLLLINNVKETKAFVTMIVESPSFSGHAYLAAAGNRLVMLPFTYLMFHTSSAFGADCSKEEGMDRLVPNSEHCQILLDAHMFETNKMIDMVTFLTAEEQIRLKTGHTIIITSEEYNYRSTR